MLGTPKIMLSNVPCVTNVPDLLGESPLPLNKRIQVTHQISCCRVDYCVVMTSVYFIQSLMFPLRMLSPL